MRPSRALDVAVLTAIGWTVRPVATVAEGWDGRTYEVLDARGQRRGYQWDSLTLYQSNLVPFVSTLWPAAGELLEWLAGQERWAEVGYNPSLGQWQAIVTNEADAEYHGSGESGPLALAKAVFAAFGGGA